MRYLLIKDKKKRKIITNGEKRRKILKYLIQQPNLEKFALKQKFIVSQQYYNLYSKKKFSYINTKNRCLISFRGKSIYRKYGCSRHFIKSLINTGSISGLRKIGF